MGLRLIAAAASEPVTLAEAKSHMRIEHAEDDLLVAGLIIAAREWCETYAGRQYITATWEQTFDDAFPAEIELSRAPLQSVETIKYVDTNGVLQTLVADSYQVSTSSVQGVVKPAYGLAWPSARSGYDAVQVRFAAGYGDTASAVPETAKVAIKMLVAHLYEHREGSVERTLSEVPFGIKSLLDEHAAHWQRIC